MLFCFKTKFKVSYPYPLGYPVKVVIKHLKIRALLGWLYQKYAENIEQGELLISERIVELSLLHQWFGDMSLGAGSEILEVGHAASSVSLELASLGHLVAGIDLRPYPFRHKNLTSFTGDFLAHNFGDNKFDFIYSLSVIEHFGFTERYDGKRGIENHLDEEAFSKISQLLKPSGRVVISVPYARKLAQSVWFRIYTRDELNGKLGQYFQIINQKFYARQDNQWTPVLEPSGDPDSARDGVALFLLTAKN